MKATDLLTQQGASNSKEESTSSLPYFNRHEVKDTPFDLIETEKGIIIVMGNQQVCKEVFKTTKEAGTYITKKPWELILITTAEYINKLNELKERIKTYENKQETEN